MCFYAGSKIYKNYMTSHNSVTYKRLTQCYQSSNSENSWLSFLFLDMCCYSNLTHACFKSSPPPAQIKTLLLFYVTNRNDVFKLQIILLVETHLKNVRNYIDIASARWELITNHQRFSLWIFDWTCSRNILKSNLFFSIRFYLVIFM